MSPCPSRHDLKRLLNDELTALDSARISAHVEKCAACQQLLQDLSADDSTERSLASGSSANPGLATIRADAESFLHRLETASADEPPQVQGYEVLEEVGRGAAGIVYRARHLQLDRFVAIKFIVQEAGVASERRFRFRREARAVAKLKHPNIIQIYDVGEHDRAAYLVLELAEGGSLSRPPGGLPRGPREAADILLTLAEAVEYAHRQGVVHRDLKPSNILLGPASANLDQSDSAAGQRPLASVLKISDFGLAKILSDADLLGEDMTRTGAMLGTPVYMAPEQASGRADIGPAVDIYSLGVILYELLTGRPPFQAPTAVETLVQAVHQDPVPLRRLSPKIPRDLETICLKCLEKRPERRYPSAAALAADLQRYLRGEPIQARPTGWPEQLTRWVRRHPGVSALLATIGLLLTAVALAALAVAAHFHDLEDHQRQLVIEKESQRLKAVTAENREGQLRSQAEQKSEELRQTLYFARMNQIGRALLSPSGGSQLDALLAAWNPDHWPPGQPDLRNWEWYYFNGLSHRERSQYRGHLEPVYGVAWNPDGRRFASASTDDIIWIWDARDDDRVLPILAHQEGVTAIGWNATGDLLASAGNNGTIKIWEASSGGLRKTIHAHEERVMSLAWNPRDDRIASGGKDRMVRVWQLNDDQTGLMLQGHTDGVKSVAWSPDGSRLASGSMDHTIRLWDVQSRSEVSQLHGHINGVVRLDWSPDGSKLLSASTDRTGKVWDAANFKELVTLTGHAGPVFCAAWSSDGARIATGGGDQTIKLWDSTDGRCLATLFAHSGEVQSLSWNPDGELVSGNHDGSVKIWDADSFADSSILRGHGASVSALDWSTDGNLLASAALDQTIRVWNTRRREQVCVLRGHTEMIRSVSWEPNGARLATASSDQTVRIWNADRQSLDRTIIGHSGEVFGVSWSPDSKRIASCGLDRTVRIWDARSGEPLHIIPAHRDWVRSVAWSPDSQKLASASWDHSVRVWDAETAAPLLNLVGHGGEVFSVAWSHDGRWILSASRDRTCRIWDAANGQVRHILRGHASEINAANWSIDDTRIATVGGDRTVRLWDPETGSEVTSLTTPNAEAAALAWNPRLPVLATAWDDNCIRLYDDARGKAAAKEKDYLATLDDRLRVDPADSTAWREKSEFLARDCAWDEAAACARSI